MQVPQNIVLFSRHCQMLASKQHCLSKKHGNFPYVIKTKCFSFHGLRKCVVSKEQHFIYFNGKLNVGAFYSYKYSIFNYVGR